MALCTIRVLLMQLSSRCPVSASERNMNCSLVFYWTVRFSFVRARLKEELAQNPSTETTINLVRGMSFVKVKMYPVEALEEWFRFLKELGNNYLLMRDKDVKHAFSAMFVEILGPVAAVSLVVKAVVLFCVSVLHLFCTSVPFQADLACAGIFEVQSPCTSFFVMVFLCRL